MRAAQDVGIQITSSNRNTGTIFGQRDRVGVTIQIIQHKGLKVFLAGLLNATIRLIEGIGENPISNSTKERRC